MQNKISQTQPSVKDKRLVSKLVKNQFSEALQDKGNRLSVKQHSTQGPPRKRGEEINFLQHSNCYGSFSSMHGHPLDILLKALCKMCKALCKMCKGHALSLAKPILRMFINIHEPFAVHTLCNICNAIIQKSLRQRQKLLTNSSNFQRTLQFTLSTVHS